MANFDFNDFLNKIKEEVEALAIDMFKNFKGKAIDDNKSFLVGIEEDLKRWTVLYSEGKLSDTDFKCLLNGKKDLIELKALTEAGLALVELDKFKANLIKLIADSIFKLVKRG